MKSETTQKLEASNRLPQLSSLILLAVTALLSVSLLAQGTTQGYAVIRGSGAGAPVASALFSLRKGDVLISEAAIEGTLPIQSGRVLVDPAIATGLALANGWDQEVDLKLTLRNGQGQALGEPRALELGPGAQTARFVDDLFPNGLLSAPGSLTFEVVTPSSPGVGAVTIRQGINLDGAPLFATLPVAVLKPETVSASENLVLPHLGAGSGLTTQILLISRSGSTTNATIRLFGTDGAPMTLELDGTAGNSFEITLSPNGVFQGTLNTPAGTRQGYAVVSFNGPAPAATAIFQFRDSQARLISEAGVGARQSTRRFRIFVDTIQTQIGMAVANAGNTAVDLSLALLNRQGQILQTRSLQLVANGQTAAFARDLFPELPQNFTGQIEVTGPDPVVPISLKLTRNRLGNLILTTLPVADLENPVTADPILLAQIGFGTAGDLELATRLILISPEPEAVLSSSLSFFAMDGSPLTVPLAGDQASTLSLEFPAGGAGQLRPGNSNKAREILFFDQVRGTEVVVNAGSDLQLQPLVLDEAGQLRDDFQILFSSNDPDVAKVSALGLITAREQGFATLTASTGPALSVLTVTVPEALDGLTGFQITGLVSDSNQKLFLAASGRHTILTAKGLLDHPDLYAGTDQQTGFRDDKRLNALFNSPGYLALNQARGVLYVSDTLNHRVRLVEPGQNGRVQVLAGGESAGSADGPALVARFNQPQGVILDDRGNLWVADSGNHTVRSINLSTNRVKTVAGLAGEVGFSDGVGTQARFNQPTGLALEPEPLALRLKREERGDPPPPLRILVADSGNGAIRRVTENGLVETLSAPINAIGPSSVASAAIFGNPTDVAVDNLGNIFVSDQESSNVGVFLRTGELVLAAQAGTFTEPRGLAVTDLGALAVADGDRLGRSLSFGSPRIDSFSPTRIAPGSEGEILIQGRNFAPDSLLVVGGRLVDEMQVIDSRTIRFTAPNLPSGRITLSLQHRGGLVQESLVVESFPLDGLPPGAITTVVGGSSFRGDGGPAIEASFNLPAGLDVGIDGAVFVVDRNNHRIRRIDPITGVINTVAGTGLFEGFDLGDGGPALAASLFFPEDVALGARGELIIADTFHDRIRSVDPATGMITTIAGNGLRGFSGDGGQATQASLDTPEGVAVDRQGNIFVADALNHRIRVIDSASGTIATVAGNGEPGDSGDGGPALFARLNRPRSIAISPEGFLLIADPGNSRIRQVDLDSGLIQTVAGDGIEDFFGDGGPATSASLRNPLGLAFDLNGNLVIADTGNYRIRGVSAEDQIISTLAGAGPPGELSGDGGDALEAHLNFPYNVAVEGSGSLLISDSFNHRIRTVNPDNNLISTLAGTAPGSNLGDDGPATEAALAVPHVVAVTTDDFLFVLDTFHERLREVDLLNGQIRSVAVLPGNFTGMAIDRVNDIFLADSLGHYVTLITPALDIIRVAGQPGSSGFSGDNGPATQAQLNSPAGLATDQDLNLYIADRRNHRVRRVNVSDRVIFTVAGNGNRGFSGDGGPATQAALNEPVALALDADGNLYISDRANHRIRRVNRSGIVTTVAGTGVPGYSGDGGPAEEAQLFRPRSIVFDNQGNLIIADEYNDRVRRVDATTGVITTVAGTGVAGFSGDGGPAIDAQLFSPGGLASDNSGNLYIADLINNRVRAVRAPAGSSPTNQLLRTPNPVHRPLQWLWGANRSTTFRVCCPDRLNP